MQRASAPITKDLVLVGGGHSHVAVLRAFGMRPVPGVRVSLIGRDLHTPYSGMLPGLIAGDYDFDDAHIDLGPLAAFAGARLIHASVTGLDLAAGQVICEGRPPIPFDLLSINSGATPRLDHVPGAAERVVAVKPINNFLNRWQALVARVLARGARSRIAVVGGGAGGVEILLAAARRLRQLATEAGRDPTDLAFHLVAASATVLPSLNPRAQAYVADALAATGIACSLGRRVAAVDAAGLVFAEGGRLDLDEILWATEAAAAPWLAGTGLALDARGFIAVDSHLRSLSHANVFAVGDVAGVAGQPREKAGVFAVRQGPPLAWNLRAVLEGRPTRAFVQQRRFLTLIGTANGRAVAARGAFAAEGRHWWHLKQWIDRRFMRRYSDLPPVIAAPGEPEPRCAGCGAKLPGEVLELALGRLGIGAAGTIPLGVAAREDAAAIQPPPGALVVQSVDFFRALVDDPFLFGQIAANHALGDLHAMGADPHSALAIATVPQAATDKMADVLYQMLEGARVALARDGATLVGGHSAEGAELGLGLAVTGFATPERLWRKGGLRPGDRLILTRALGTGVLFAAQMRRRAKARWIEAALRSMLQAGGDAAAILRAHGATACTDVTGFGLFGHAREMAQASRAALRISLGALPVLDGAAELLAGGIASTLAPANAAAAAGAAVGSVSGDPLLPIVFDPQTAGGLLAGVPAERADACLAALRAGGCASAAVVGEVSSGDATGRVTVVP